MPDDALYCTLPNGSCFKTGLLRMRAPLQALRHSHVCTSVQTLCMHLQATSCAHVRLSRWFEAGLDLQTPAKQSTAAGEQVWPATVASKSAGSWVHLLDVTASLPEDGSSLGLLLTASSGGLLAGDSNSC